MPLAKIVLLSVLCLVPPARVLAQTTQQPPAPTPAPSPAKSSGWDIAVYPIYGWVPLFIGIEVDRPEGDGDSGAGISGKILDSRFDGAYLGGIAATNGRWYLAGAGIWAGFGGDRRDSPFMDVDMDVIYGDVQVGRRLTSNLYATAGVRRLALNYDIHLGDLPAISEKPGFWDPLIGVAWHRPGEKFLWHAAFETGGFGLGADVEFATNVRVDWKISRRVGLTAGYGTWHVKFSRTVRDKPMVMKASFHGPSIGFGIYF